MDPNLKSYLRPRLLKKRNTNSFLGKVRLISREYIYTNTRDGLGWVPWADAVWAKQAEQKAEVETKVIEMDVRDQSSIFFSKSSVLWGLAGCLDRVFVESKWPAVVMIGTVCSWRLGGSGKLALWRIGVETRGDREPISNKVLRCHCVQVKHLLQRW